MSIRSRNDDMRDDIISFQGRKDDWWEKLYKSEALLRTENFFKRIIILLLLI